MVLISPSVLACDFSKMGEEVKNVLDGGADWIHFDVMDGHFVPNLSIGAPVLQSLSRAVPAFYDVHLMLDDPLTYAKDFAKAGASLISFHIEAPVDPYEVVAELRRLHVKAGIVLKPKTPASAIADLLPLVDLVLVMTVEPGFGGQKFMADMCQKVSDVAALAQEAGCPDLLIEVDGGIAPDTAAQVIRAGANVLVAGSSVFGAADRAGVMQQMRNAR